MSYVLEDIARTLKEARARKGLSQRELGEKVGLPQSHVSKIESGRVDLKLSSLVELTRILDLELMPVPRKLVPAVRGIIRNAETPGVSPADKPMPAYRLDDSKEDSHG